MSKRKSCLTETMFHEGQEVFVPDPEQVWIPGIIKNNNGSCLLVKTEQQEVMVNKDDVLFQPSENNANCDYLTKLTLINPATVLNCLDVRFHQDIIYTVGGNMLVAVNPFKDLPSIYEQDVLLLYANNKDNSLGPHIYSSAKSAFNCMVQGVGKSSQIIVVSGESGSGKTMSAMYLLKYLTFVSSLQTSLESSFTSSSIEKKILKSNPILEAFGNATTTRNENSSRFGKFTQLYFNRSGNMKGASICTYLLEKTRVTHQGRGECNFHIFYQMLQGLKNENVYDLQNRYGINDCLKFRVLPECSGRAEDVDKRKLENTLQALKEVGVSEYEKQSIFQVLLGILYLCNIEFTKGRDEECALIKTNIESVSGVVAASKQFGVDNKKLEQVLLNRSIHSGGKSRRSVFVKPVRIEEAKSRRDCLATLLYSKLFDWLVKFINNQFKTKPCQEIIGLLDIYGFEHFELNSLEQLCINYANERLQQHFIQLFLRNLQEEYMEENIGWTFTDFTDNQPCIDMLDGIPGIFALLNEEVYLNRPVDTKSLGERLQKLTCGGLVSCVPNEISKSHAKSKMTPKPTGWEPTKKKRPGFSRPTFPSDVTKYGNKQITGSEFIVKHFADDVTYQVLGLVDKNKDNIPTELEVFVMSSQFDFLKQIMDSSINDLEKVLFEPPTKKKKTVLTKFKSSLDQLLFCLNNSGVHYVRCLKPNKQNVPGVFDRPHIMTQLKASGIIETIKISQQGHPARFTYQAFLQRYYMILSQKKRELNNNQLNNSNHELLDNILESLFYQRFDISKGPRNSTTPRKVLRRRTVADDSFSSNGLASLEHLMKCCATVLAEVCLPENGVFDNTTVFTNQFGKSKIFLSQIQFDKLESARSLVMIEKVSIIQRVWRRYQKYQNHLKRKKAVLVIEKAVLRWLKYRRDHLNQLLAMAHNLELNDTGEAGVKPLSNVELNSSSSRVDSNANQPDNIGRLIELDAVKSFFKMSNASSSSTSDCQETENDKHSLRRTCFHSGFGPDPGEPPQKRLKISCQQYASLKNVSVGDGVVSRRRLPRASMRFHTKPSILKNAHVSNFKESQCSLTDILPDIS